MIHSNHFFILFHFKNAGCGPLNYLRWAFLLAQTVKNPPAVRKTWVWSLAWQDSLEECMTTYSRILAWRIPTDRGAWVGYSPRGHNELDTNYLGVATRRVKNATPDHKFFIRSLWKRVSLVKWSIKFVFIYYICILLCKGLPGFWQIVKVRDNIWEMRMHWSRSSKRIEDKN